MPAFGEGLGALAAELRFRGHRGGVREGGHYGAQERRAINRAPQIVRQGQPE